MYTANTMASAIEALGMSLPNSSAQDAISDQKREDCAARRGGGRRADQARHPAAADHDAQGVRERDHGEHRARRLDQCRAAPAGDGLLGKCQIALDDFTRIGKRVPVLADLRPERHDSRCPSWWRSAASSR